MAVFAPLHNRLELDGIALIETLFQEYRGTVRQVAVFDTGFHSSLPDAAAIYPGPYDWVEQGIRKFGFHGINHQYCAGRAAQILGKNLADLKLISCHLGNGCSLAAIRGGKSIDTTMGFTPLDGLMMGTRSGSVDPGILTYLMREKKLDGQALDEILNSKSGLLGISGVSADMREVTAAMLSGSQRAQLAFDIFVHRLRAAIGSMLAALDGADAIIFHRRDRGELGRSPLRSLQALFLSEIDARFSQKHGKASRHRYLLAGIKRSHPGHQRARRLGHCTRMLEAFLEGLVRVLTQSSDRCRGRSRYRAYRCSFRQT